MTDVIQESRNLFFGTTLPLIEVRSDQVVFGGNAPSSWSWGASEYGEARPMAPAKFIIDRRYWEYLGKPVKLCVGIANDKGWEKYVGIPTGLISAWYEAYQSKVRDDESI